MIMDLSCTLEVHYANRKKCIFINLKTVLLVFFDMTRVELLKIIALAYNSFNGFF